METYVRGFSRIGKDADDKYVREPWGGLQESPIHSDLLPADITGTNIYELRRGSSPSSRSHFL
ncbi:MAG: hypothetical protein Ct9H90mP24_0360 [Methanobacteriota archaeon]|nr:MAG: hypothetical protein Ct9H90mP24_0360 [Euryarchaeota archaeon]